jgi:hypothetical protein
VENAGHTEWNNGRNRQNATIDGIMSPQNGTMDAIMPPQDPVEGGRERRGRGRREREADGERQRERARARARAREREREMERERAVCTVQTRSTGGMREGKGNRRIM